MAPSKRTPSTESGDLSGQRLVNVPSADFGAPASDDFVSTQSAIQAAATAATAAQRQQRTRLRRGLVGALAAIALLMAAIIWALVRLHRLTHDWHVAVVIALVACSGWLAAVGSIFWRASQRLLAGRDADTEATISQLVETFCMSVEMKDPYTRGHSERTTAYLLYLAEHVYSGLASADEARLRYGGLLHDIGKIYVPEHVLKKPDKLLAEEFELVRTHPQTGADIVGNIPNLKSVIPIILHHHERYDGRGYPAGLSGHDIPLEARMAAIADTFDAMTSTRAYRGSLSVDAALQEIISHSGEQFDPELVSVFVRHFDGFRRLHHELHQKTWLSTSGM